MQPSNLPTSLPSTDPSNTPSASPSTLKPSLQPTVAQQSLRPANANPPSTTVTVEPSFLLLGLTTTKPTEKVKDRSSASSNQALQGPNAAGIIAAVVLASLLCCVLIVFFCVRYYRRNENLRGVFGRNMDTEISSWINSNSGGINIMKREGQNDDDKYTTNTREKDDSKTNFSFTNLARGTLQSIRLSSRLGFAADVNPMISPAPASETGKEVASDEFHMNYLGYGESASDVPVSSSSSSRVVSSSSKIRLDQDRSTSVDVVVDPFRSTFHDQRSYVVSSDSQTI